MKQWEKGDVDRLKTLRQTVRADADRFAKQVEQHARAEAEKSFSDYEQDDIAALLLFAASAAVEKHAKALPLLGRPPQVWFDYEWSTRDGTGVGWLAQSEEEARARITDHPEWTLYRRVVHYGQWEDR